MNAYENLCIKLAINPDQGQDPPVFYRFTYADIQDDPMAILGRRAVRMNGDKVEDFKKYEIVFHYEDSDGDRVLIDTEAGLKVAMEEAINAGNKLKLFAHLNKAGHAQKSVEESCVANVTINPNQPFIHGNHQCAKCNVTPIIGLRFSGIDAAGKAINVCEACKGDYQKVVKPAMDALDVQFQQQWRKKHRQEFRKAVEDKKQKMQAERLAAKQMRQQMKKLNAGKGWKALKKDLQEDPEVKMVIDADKSKNFVVINKVHPFIHGNHQCTECGKEPIIGNRFVLDDKQLCDDCGKNYEGAEKAQDAADMEFQKQWRREHREIYQPIVQSNKAKRQALLAEQKNKRIAERQENRKAKRVAARQEKLRSEKEAEMEWQDVAEPDIIVEQE